MDAREFIEIIKENEHLLDNTREKHQDEETGCPLRVALMFVDSAQEYLDMILQWGRWMDPDPTEVAQVLELDDTYAHAVANGWDMGRFYGDEESESELLLQFSGFLTSVVLRPAPLCLPEAK